MSKKQIAFTLIELLVVIAIIGILSGLIVVAMGGITSSANVAKGKVFSNSLRNSLMLNLVSEWKFDGPTGDNQPATVNDVLDTWSKVNNGAPSATPPTVRTGTNCVNGSCLQFDGSTNYVDFGNNASLSMGTGSQTVSLWVKFDNATAPKNEMLALCGVASGGTGQDGYWIYRKSGTDRLYCLFTDGSAGYMENWLSGTGTLAANTWYNVVVVFNRAVSAQAYINGVKQTGYSLDITPQQGDVQNTLSFKIGAYNISNYQLAGKMDEVRVYNAAMPTSQIREQYYAGLNKLMSNKAIDAKEYQKRLAEWNSFSAYSK